jgi:capsule assembly protein Wzi
VSVSRPATARALVACLLFAAATPAGWARGASPYLPLNLSPEIERQIERVLILADKPITSRPIAAATVLDALPAACRIDAALCTRVRRYLDGYMRKIGLTHASVEVVAYDGAVTTLPNRHGASSDSEWVASAQGYWQPSDYLVVSLGGAGDADDAVATGSMLSAGFDFAQLDVGYRDHWFSPFTDSAMIISTEARTLPSVTLSNYRPLTGLGFSYEVFLAEMEHSDRIVFNNDADPAIDADDRTSGKPRLAGLRFSIEPTPGWSLSANRLMQFGGGERGGSSFGDFIDALTKPHQKDNSEGTDEFGNQIAAWTSRFIFPGRTPFAAYLEYAGEDSSYEGNYRLGNAALSVGITFPRLWRRFDLTYEASEWQNGWYVHDIYLDGMTNDSHVLGHWGADRRVFADAVGAQTHMLRIGWNPPFGGYLQLQARTVANESYGSNDYERGYDAALSYSRGMYGFTVGAEVLGGRDVFGESFSRIAGFVRFGDDWETRGVADGWAENVERPRGADLFVDAGINFSELAIRLDGSPAHTESLGAAAHFAIGARRAVTERSDLGVRAEFDDIDGDLLFSVRALDYRYRFHNPLAVSVFLGASRLDLATPAYGYYYGAGVQWRNLFPGIDLSLDLRYGDKIARDKLLPSDGPSEKRPDSFYDLTGATLSLSYRW